MDRIKIDFLRAKYDLATPKERGVFLFTRIFLAAVIVSAVTGLTFSYTSTNSEGGAVGFFTSIARLVSSGDKQLAGEKDDRVNFLLLGVGGKGHDGAELADTILFSSYRPSTSEVGMLSIPRDLLVPIPGYEGWRKVNSINAYAEAEEKGSGPVVTSEVLGGLLDQEIHYYVKINFDGFETFIDELGGVNVYVERSFSDYQYPEYEGSPTYMTVSFKEGWQHMDGKTALQFARSRHGNNGEGSDFARAARQQKILLAVKSELLSGSTLLNPGRISKLFETVKENVVTNMAPWELIRLASYLPNIDDQAISHHVLNDPSLVNEQMLNGMYALLPANYDWHPIQRLAANLFNPEESNIAIEAPEEEAPQFVSVEIQNGTNITGLAFRASQLLQGAGFEVEQVGNAESRDYKHTVIYDLTNGQKPDELNALRDMLAADVSMSAAGWVFTNEIVPTDLAVSQTPASESAGAPEVDFLIILGENTANLVMR